jgi:hypothetical protein
MQIAYPIIFGGVPFVLANDSYGGLAGHTRSLQKVGVFFFLRSYDDFSFFVTHFIITFLSPTGCFFGTSLSFSVVAFA